MNENRTLMFYINSLNRGGAQRVLVQLAGRFAAAGWRSVLVTSFVSEEEYPVPPGVERVSIEQAQLAQSALRRNLSRIAARRALIRQYAPAALISFMAEPNFRAVLAACGLPVKTIVSVRNDPNREYSGHLFRFVGKHLLPRADGCVFQTRDAMAWFPESLQRRSAVIMNQVSERFFEEPPAEEHRDIRFYVDGEERIYRVFAAFQTKVYQEREDVFKYYEAVGDLSQAEYESTVENVRALSVPKLPDAPKYPAQLMFLSTCSYHTEDGRFVVAAYRIK